MACRQRLHSTSICMSTSVYEHRRHIGQGCGTLGQTTTHSCVPFPPFRVSTNTTSVSHSAAAALFAQRQEQWIQGYRDSYIIFPTLSLLAIWVGWLLPLKSMQTKPIPRQRQRRTPHLLAASS
ncbi:uncharacterized protein LACBIDRAFT_313609 [Laccaria bicolor S238N-H82]|uniref:Predicted protein n=1 Tax=Laccaria bicolor (strain S238N-H82 / ATCC MYA-4686) TaxID=486041 RepID=B0D0E1_LACBS|nr:uncharacterized protein LACBIDRAFT_313609 [Laccaria bicolor S238N-H82]EDR11440.1 predicted protein [Laccaria bicolor S238N-H82]|eukprot:XP_001877337.1 predicted protein [Laccaria bicolor S238N-H82]